MHSLMYIQRPASHLRTGCKQQLFCRLQVSADGREYTELKLQQAEQGTCTRTVGAGEGASRIRCSRRLRRVLALQYILVRRSQA